MICKNNGTRQIGKQVFGIFVWFFYQTDRKIKTKEEHYEHTDFRNKEKFRQ